MADAGYFRALFRSGLKPWGNALLEVLVIIVVSLIPLLGAAIREMLPVSSTIYLSDAFAKALLGGQLLYYALGLIATVVWQCNKDFEPFYPLRIFFNLYCIIGVVFCAIVIGYDPTLSKINTRFIAQSSVYLFLSAVIAYVVMAVLLQVHADVRQDLSSDDKTLERAVRLSRGIK